MILLRALARKLRDFSLSMTNNSRFGRDFIEVNIEAGHTDKVGRTQPSEFLFFLRGTDSKLVPIHSVPISWSRTVTVAAWFRKMFPWFTYTIRYAGMGTGISEASKRVPLLPRETSKRVPIFDRGTGSKTEMLRSGFLQADLSLIDTVFIHSTLELK